MQDKEENSKSYGSLNVKSLSSSSAIMEQFVKAVSKLYDAENGALYSKDIIETIVGAGIWYLPSGHELFSGKISVDALSAFLKDPAVHLTEEHQYPRKIAARYLLEKCITDNGDIKLMETYLNSIGVFNLVLREENKRLANFQKSDVFKSPEEAYHAANIKLVDIGKGFYSKYKQVKNKLDYRRKTSGKVNKYKAGEAAQSREVIFNEQISYLTALAEKTLENHEGKEA